MPGDPTLRLPADATTTLFRLVEAQLRADPVLAATVKTWRTWQGRTGDKLEAAPSDCPWVRLTPRFGPESWWAASTMKGFEYIAVEIAVRGTCYDDVANLWGAIQRACYPADAAARLAFQARLRDAGAYTGLTVFTRPALTQEPPDDDLILGAGQIAFEYRFDTNPTAPGF